MFLAGVEGQLCSSGHERTDDMDMPVCTCKCGSTHEWSMTVVLWQLTYPLPTTQHSLVNRATLSILNNLWNFQYVCVCVCSGCLCYWVRFLSSFFRSYHTLAASVLHAQMYFMYIYFVQSVQISMDTTTGTYPCTINGFHTTCFSPRQE